MTAASYLDFKLRVEIPTGAHAFFACMILRLKTRPLAVLRRPGAAHWSDIKILLHRLSTFTVASTDKRMDWRSLAIT